MNNSIYLSFIRLSFLLISLLVACSHNSEKGYYSSFIPGELWFDTDSVHINAHGGGILFHEDVYYWFGEFKTAGRGGNTALVGVQVYSSTDLYNWKNEGTALEVVDVLGHDIERGSVIERPKVLYNEKTGKFVMWFHLELKGQGYSAARTAVAVADHVTGPYEFIESLRPNAGHWPMNFNQEFKELTETIDDFEWWTPDWEEAVHKGLFIRRDFEGGQMARDMTLFLDDDGTAYHIFSSEENLTLHIAELSDDFLSHTGRYKRIFPLGHNEAPAVFKHNDLYYMIASGCTGWEPNAARSFVAENVFGPWTALGNPCVGSGAEITFQSQSTFVLPVQGKEGAFIYMGDRWRPHNPIDGRYVWLPIVFKNDRPIIEWYDEWDLSIFDN
ncbi:glycoside hydrolase family 43 protein [Alkalitalea saponilacus]|uniref:Glycosyl hydrolases family 43 n=1 Tax=Alkalitalea saponilacus TaxID=889453 RepID=A0A1T5F929_9BACT|nr:glycoside hydrolase family 43 protein [Alkalitalea saponilacus]ASB50117.1 beta-glucanase [Alkalitalea saponilacus]SKB92634.1 Glycosyl hydrolases family 43 [Alkalitalea saponilacus]